MNIATILKRIFGRQKKKQKKLRRTNVELLEDRTLLVAPSTATFSDLTQLAAGNDSADVQIGDLDGDNDLDAFVVNTDGQANRIWINQGGNQGGASGTFAVTGQALGMSDSEGVALGDMDGDGDLDAFVANTNDQPNTVWINQGGLQGGTEGAFANSGQMLGLSSSQDVALADLDGDNDLDAFVANTAGQGNRIWINQGGGTFVGGAAYGNSNSKGIALGDFDGDGDRDVFVANGDNQGNRVWMNQGGFQLGTEGVFQSFGPVLGTGPSEDVALGDIDGDNDLDVYVSNTDGQANRVYLNQGVQPPPAFAFLGFLDSGQSLGSSSSQGVALGDLDGDNDLDALVANTDRQSNTLWINQGGVFVADARELSNADSQAVALGDLDGDGDLDAYVADLGQANQVWINNGITSLGSLEIALGDLDGDTDLDAFIANGSGQPNSVWINQGGSQGGTPGVFGDSGQALGNSDSAGVTLGDVDGDGDLDAFVANFNNQPNRIYLNNGNGVFADSGQVLGADSSDNVGLVDLDADGDLDAFIANVNGNRVWINQGGLQGGTKGVFVDSNQDLGSSQSTDVAMTDVDGDGDFDAFVTNTNNQDNKVWINQGGSQNGVAGVFIGSGQFLGASSSEGVATRDVDGDGDEDAFVANFGQADRLWINQGGAQGGTAGVFVDSGQAFGSFNSEMIQVEDLDGDGDLDFFVANFGQGNRVWLNRGGTFDDSTQVLGVADSNFVALGDLDGDDDFDAFVVNRGEGNVIWYNQSTVDFGDAADTYHTTQNANGARHVGIGPMLGPTRDSEVDGAPSPGADGDDTAGSDDEDGVTFASVTVGQVNAEVTVNVQGVVTTTFVDAWIDFNKDGSFDGDGEQIIANQVVINGDNTINYFPATDAVSGTALNARFRLSTAGGLGPHGPAFDGEVEDYQVTLSLAGTTGTYTEFSTTTGSFFSNDVDLGDLDGDGDLDAFVVNGSTLPNRVWLNDGQSRFPTSIPVGSSNSQGVALGDFDKDGDLDAFVVNLNQPNRIWLNDGSASFTDSGQLLRADSSRSVALGDVDGDGDLDAVVSNDDQQGNRVWINQGGFQLGVIGTFVDSGQSLGDSESQNIALADLDGDGDLDQFVSNVGRNKVWLNDGQGNFTDTGQVFPTSESTQAALGDIDNDGDLDAVVANDFEDDAVWLNDGTGTFTQNVGQAFGNPESRGVILIDVDSDTDLDAFFVNDALNPNQIFLNNGSGSFTDSGVLMGEYNSVAAAFGDLNGDGDLDIFIANTNDVNRIWRGIGFGGNFDFGDAPDTYGTSLANNGARHDIFGSTIGPTRDFEVAQPSATANGDDNLDMDDEDGVTFGDAVVGQVNAEVTVNVATTGAPLLDAWIDFNNDGTFNEAREQIASSLPVVNGDNLLRYNVPHDAVSGETLIARFRLSDAGGLGPRGLALDGEVEDHTLVIKQPKGAGSFGDSGQLPNVSNATAAAMGDFDGDGDVDAIVANSLTSNRVLENQGDGTFAFSQSLGSYESNDVAVGDVDGDGDLDAVFANQGAGFLARDRVYINQGGAQGGTPGSFLDNNMPLSQAQSRGIALSDFDSDGDLDAFFVTSTDIRVYRNEGRAQMGAEGTFTLTSTLTTDTNNNDVAMGDVDDDGDVDAIVIRSSGTRVWMNDGSGNFSPGTTTLIGGNAIELADLDGDSDLDAFAATNNRNRVLVNQGGFQGSTPGVFNPSFQLLGNSTSQGVALGDVDADGDIDAFVGNTGSNRPNRLWINQGGVQAGTEGQFSDSGRALGSRDTFGVAMGDIDRDGDLDVYAADTGNDIVWVNLGPFDFGDAPNSFGTLLGSDGARHDTTGPTLGATRGGFAAFEFQDGLNGYTSTDDTFVRSSSADTSFGTDTTIQVDSSPTTQGLIKFNNLFGEGPNQIPLGYTITNATLTLNVSNTSAIASTISFHRMLSEWDENATYNSLVAGVQTNNVEARFTSDATIAGNTTATVTISSAGLVSTVQSWADGAVNYGWLILNNNSNDWQVRSSESSPAPKLTIEISRDAELDGSPTTYADGDDNNFSDDEDGVAFSNLFVGQRNATATVDVRHAPAGALLNAWLDFNDDGVFTNSPVSLGGELIASNVAVTNGNNTITFDIPDTAKTNATLISRFRLNTIGGLGPKGEAVDGEVEDHVALIRNRASDGTVDIPDKVPAKVTENTGGFGTLEALDNFGISVVVVGDVDNDGIEDVVVGAPGDDTGGVGTTADRGAVHVLLMNANGTVKMPVKIAHNTGGFPNNQLVDGDRFGSAVTLVGDSDSNGRPEIAVGAPGDDATGTDKGAVYILELNTNGTVALRQTFEDNTSNLGSLPDGGQFGSSLAGLGDLDGSGRLELAAGSPFEDIVGVDRGVVRVLSLNNNSSINTSTIITDGTGGFGALMDSDQFGASVAGIGDIDGDSVRDLAVGAIGDDSGGPNRGAVYVLQLNANGTVKATTKIADSTSGLGTLSDDDEFGQGLSGLDDVDGDGVQDLAVGVSNDDTGGPDRGAVYVLLLKADGTIRRSHVIADGVSGGLPANTLNNDDFFGSDVSAFTDLDGDGVKDLIVGAVGDADGGDDAGAIYILNLTPAIDFGDAPDPAFGTGTNNYRTLTTDVGPTHAIDYRIFMGSSVDGQSEATPNVNADGDDQHHAPADDEDGLVDPAADLQLVAGTQPNIRVRVTNTTGVEATVYGWIDYNADGVFDNATERAQQAVPDGTTSGIATLAFPSVPSGVAQTYARFRFSTDPNAADSFGPATNGEVEDHVVTVTSREPSDGTVDDPPTIIADGQGVISSDTFLDDDNFGWALTPIGDLDTDGVIDLIAGVPGDDTGGTDRGAVFVLNMNTNGTVKTVTQIADGVGGLAAATLADGDGFGSSVTSLGDLDGDGVTEVFVGANGDDTGGTSNLGAGYVLFMQSNGTIGSFTKIAEGMGGLPGGTLGNEDQFGSAARAVGDVNGDGITDVLVGAPGDDTGGTDRGAVYVLSLLGDGSVNSILTTIADGSGLAANTLSDGDRFGSSIGLIGDLNTDSVNDVIVGATGDDSDRGAAYVLLMNSGGVVNTVTKIANGSDGIALPDGGEFGASAVGVGDLDGDSVLDVAVGSFIDTGAGGAVRTLFMNSNGTVKGSRIIADGLGGLPAGTLDVADHFGSSIAVLGDLDGDDVLDLAVGASDDDTNGTDRGAVYVLNLTPAVDFGDAPDPNNLTGTNNYSTRTANNGPSHDIDPRIFLGAAIDGQTDPIANLAADGDDTHHAVPNDEDGIVDPFTDLRFTTNTQPQVRVRATNNTGGPATLIGWIDYDRNGQFETTDEEVRMVIPNNTNDQVFTLTFPTIPLLCGSIECGGTTYARFRISTDPAALLPTGAAMDGEVEDYQVHITASTDVSVTATTKIADSTGGMGTLVDEDMFGAAVAPVGNLDGLLGNDIVVGAPGDDTSGTDRGAVHVLLLNSDETVNSVQTISNNQGGLGPVLDNGDQFGVSVASLGKLDNDGLTDIAVGAIGDDTGGTDRGAVHVLSLNADGTVKSSQLIAHNTGGMGALDDSDGFGSAITTIGDLDGDGVQEVVVSATGDGADRGAVYVLFMNTDGTVKATQKIADGVGGLASNTLANGDRFGSALADLGDLNADGNSELAVGAAGDDGTSGSNRGAVYILSLDANGMVNPVVQKIADTTGGLGALVDGDAFGSSLSSAGDLNADGFPDLAVGAVGDDTGGTDRGALHMLLLDANGAVTTTYKIADSSREFGTLTDEDSFGVSVTALGDVNGDGRMDLAVGANKDDTGGSNRGAVYIVNLTPNIDFGDAPDPSNGVATGNYQTRAADNGPRHLIDQRIFMGPAIDAESDGQESAAADGDDVARVPDDEDGVNDPLNDLFLVPNTIPVVNVTVTNNTGLDAILTGWIDYDRSGTFSNGTERSNVLTVPNGTNGATVQLTFPIVPGGVSSTFARFRLTTRAGDPGPTGLYTDGEVEDYAVEFGAFDFGDAPDISNGTGAGDYQTFFVNGGPRHNISGPRLGALADSEADGLQSLLATGDDLDNSSDEDGVSFNPLLIGRTSSADVTVTGENGQVDAWIDFNQNGVFTDPGEQIITNQPVMNGNTKNFSINVPATATLGRTIARFRVSRTGGLGPNGAALNSEGGEVEDYQVNIAALDFGDAPDTSGGVGTGDYNTQEANGGPRHIATGPLLGTLVDGESDGQQNSDATGDDTDGTNDDDGVSFGNLIVGQQSSATVAVNGAAGFVNGWIDFNRDGVFAAGEQIITDASLTVGTPATINFAVPGTANVDDTFARIRVSTTSGLGPDGFADNGEVEDYEVTIRSADFGDAPDTSGGQGTGDYDTLLANNGPQHLIVPGAPTLGPTIDAELDALPNATATGDDGSNTNDEDGVTFATALVAGQSATANVNVQGASGRVDAWVDFNQNGIFELSEKIINNLPVGVGTTVGFNFPIPAGALVGTTFARFRVSTAGNLAPNGFASDGEIEDYEVTIVGYDFGDAPDTGAGTGTGNYETLLADSGPRHTIAGPRLGSLVDSDSDGQPNAAASGDDSDGTNDEDGVTFGALFVGQAGSAEVTVTGENGRVDAWIDFNHNGSFADPGEKVIDNVLVTMGSTDTLPINVPITSNAGTTYARLRVSRNGGLAATGVAQDADGGEVEDYQLTIQAVDFGDAPDISSGQGTGDYDTLLANNGARHVLGGPVLGALVDFEANGQQSGNADGDDLDGTDDDDGVVFSNLFVGQSGTATVTVTGTSGLVDAWIDFNQDGVFDNSGASTERIVTSRSVSPGSPGNFDFNIPATATTAIARVRVSSSGGLPPIGLANNGEVEDYLLNFDRLDYGDAPDITSAQAANDYSTLLANDGPRHTINLTGPRLGTLLDDEVDALANAGATGDDTGGTNDEDGVTFGSLVAGQQGTIDVNVEVDNGQVDGWIDFNQNGVFESSEKIVDNKSVLAGTTPQFNFAIPELATLGATFARVRVSSAGNLGPVGLAANGEVEDYQVTIAGWDFGDAPDSGPGTGSGDYETLSASGGPRHTIGGPRLGTLADQEADGQPSAAADDDDSTNNDDEDGVTFDTLLVGQPSMLSVTVNGESGHVDGWIDFNQNGVFDNVTERVASEAVNNGDTDVVNFTVPGTALVGTTFARFRVSRTGSLLPKGAASDAEGGEVEDYQVTIRGLDFGDAPDSNNGPGKNSTGDYDTLSASSGPSHIVGGPLLGSLIDIDPDAFQSTDATGDDTNGGNDEDGVTISSIVAGQPATIDVTVTNADGRVDAWIDFNRDGVFAASERVINNQSVSAGVTQQFNFTVPTTISVGNSFARVRVSTVGGLGPIGMASDGEVEDYGVALEGLDFGDAPDVASGTNAGDLETLLANNGPRHLIGGPRLGASVDLETDGQPLATALGDDGDGNDDEDGVTFSGLFAGQTGTIDVNVQNADGRVDAWIDFNRNGDLSDPGEQVVTNQLVNSGMTVQFNVAVPAAAPLGLTYARVRVSSAGGLTPLGEASDGEVEDYTVAIGGYDFGDAPDISAGMGNGDYQTLNANSGPRHALDGPRLGNSVDHEADGQQDGTASGDGADDDGVTFGSFYVGQLTTTDITVTDESGRVDAWIDFNQDGDFLDPQEQIVTNQLVNVGDTDTFSFTVPGTALTGATFARVRVSRSGGLAANGPAPDSEGGEVEDYQVTVASLDFGDAPDTSAGNGAGDYNTLLTNNGPRHVIGGPRLGPATVDLDLNGQPNATATGDDGDGSDDEDGVVFDNLFAGQAGTATVSVNGANGSVDAWIDFNEDGLFDDSVGSTERIISGVPITAGNSQVFNFSIPASATSLVARVRVSSAGGLSPAGFAADGEVEDYVLNINSLDFGDAPDTTAGQVANDYSTLLANNGPAHIFVATGPRLGTLLDTELDGLQSIAADGDDIDSSDDEDGVAFNSALFGGLPGTVDVNVEVADGRVDAWIDFNQNGNFEAAEKIVDNQSVLLGTTPQFNYVVPVTANRGTTYARVRVSTSGGLGPDGPASDGEVEDYQVTIRGYDFGDAPDTSAGTSTGDYRTQTANSGPRHTIGGPQLGAAIDQEADGQQNASATGEGADDDGVAFNGLLIGQVATLDATVTNENGRIDAWMDFNHDGDFLDTGEQIATNQLVSSGTTRSILFNVPGTAMVGTTFARVRVSRTGNLPSTGNAPDSTGGEVEDYQVMLGGLDFGDAPDVTAGNSSGDYDTTVANDGPRHILGGPTLGSLVDLDADGQPTSAADGDDTDGTNDDDGVTFNNLIAGQTGTIGVTVQSAAGVVDGWIDFNQNGNFEAIEQVVASVPVALGATQNLSVPIPVTALLGSTFARFRVSSTGVAGPNGFANDGEVEDYEVTIVGFDFGDAPDTSAGIGTGDYQTLSANGGPRHTTGGPRLGTQVDQDADGQPDATANGDDSAGTDDENGVSFVSMVAGNSSSVDVTVAVESGTVDGWIDFNQNGDFSDLGEKIIDSVSVGANTTSTLTFNVPGSALDGTTFARFRVSRSGGLGPNGAAPDAEGGEVEDYQVTIAGYDFGDAPDLSAGTATGDYQTLAANGGPRHTIGGPRLGTGVDPEVDGQPSAMVNGDDTDGTDDEDGVTFASLFLGQNATASVTVTGEDGRVDAWIDFNGDGDFVDTGEKIIDKQLVAAGNTVGFSFAVPGTATTNPTVARIRVSRNGGLTAIGAAADAEGGEVEDHVVSFRAGTDSIGVWRTARFYEDVNGNEAWDGTTGGDALTAFGATDDIPVIGDWNGDGFDEFGVYRTSTSMFILDINGNHLFDAGDQVYGFGATGDIPIVGDWDGDGVSDTGVFRPTTATFHLDIDRNGTVDETVTFGASTDMPIVGDWDGDGDDDTGVRRGSNARFYKDVGRNGTVDSVVAMGATTDTPIIGDWNGDGIDDVGLFRSSQGRFFLDSNADGLFGGGDQAFFFGTTNDTPLAGNWAAPIQALDGPATSSEDTAPLVESDLTTVVNSAIDVLSSFGLRSEQLQALRSVDVQIADLADGQLGSYQNQTIVIDVNAAGHGWFVDQTPLDHEEFKLTNQGLVALGGSAAVGNYDLLTVVLHELGHALGLGDDFSDADSQQLMNGWLSRGVRRLPTEGEIAALLAQE